MKKIFFSKILLILIVSMFFRYWLISNNQVYFWFDQARDANISQSIIYNHDFKIQGPSASGTKDTIYHGVLYYYLLSPIYYIFQGNPFFVTLFFGLINSFSVVFLYIISKKIFENEKIALLSSFLLAINFEHSQYSTWLSNPMMGLIPTLIFFLSIWMIFYNKKRTYVLKWMILMGFSLGLIEQSAFYSIYFFGVIIVGLIYLSKKLKTSFYKIFSIKEILAFLFVYILTISTMLVNQFLLFKAGIFTFKVFEDAVGHSSIWKNPRLVIKLFDTFLTKFVSTISPNLPLFGSIILLITFFVLIKKVSNPKKIFLLSWFTAPLWLFIFHFRSSSHMLLGLEYMLIITFSFIIYLFIENKNIFIKGTAIVLFIAYILLQFNAVIMIRNNDSSIFTFQNGVMLKNELKLIDKTYQLVNKEPFSISIWGSPYEYYITWAYLYHWYGKQKYGYVPSYFGTSQSGKYGENLLKQKDHPEQLHFLIEEPGVYLVGDIYKQFIAKQNSFSTIVDTNSSLEDGFEIIGEYRLQFRNKIQ